jgi:hypothetical protein
MIHHPAKSDRRVGTGLTVSRGKIDDAYGRKFVRGGVFREK